MFYILATDSSNQKLTQYRIFFVLFLNLFFEIYFFVLFCFLLLFLLLFFSVLTFLIGFDAIETDFNLWLKPLEFIPVSFIYLSILFFIFIFIFFISDSTLNIDAAGWQGQLLSLLFLLKMNHFDI